MALHRESGRRRAWSLARLLPNVARELSNLAGTANLDRAELLRCWLGSTARLKRDYATRALADIPVSRFKGLPGRPSDEPDSAELPAH